MMSSFTCWIMFVICLAALLAPTQGRRARHASWLTDPSAAGPRGPTRCARCPPGWGVERRCGGGLDTACSPCREGDSYSAHHSARTACLLCSRCGPGLFAARDCSATRDTHCAACHPPPPPRRRNQDYYRRCVAIDEDMLSDAPVPAAGPDPDHEPAPAAARRNGGNGGTLASYGLSQSTLLAARSKSDMARSILADPGAAEKLKLQRQSGGPGAGGAGTSGMGRLPHVLLADGDEAFSEEYSLLHHQEAQAQAGPAYSVLTDDGPVRIRVAPAAPVGPGPHRHHGPSSPRPPPPRYPDGPAGPVRLSSPISWGRPSAPSLNTRQAFSHALLNPDSTTNLPLHLRHRTDEADMNAEEVGRLML